MNKRGKEKNQRGKKMGDEKHEGQKIKNRMGKRANK